MNNIMFVIFLHELLPFGDTSSICPSIDEFPFTKGKILSTILKKKCLINLKQLTKLN